MVAIDLITSHIQQKLQQPDLRSLTPPPPPLWEKCARTVSFTPHSCYLCSCKVTDTLSLKTGVHGSPVAGRNCNSDVHLMARKRLTGECHSELKHALSSPLLYSASRFAGWSWQADIQQPGTGALHVPDKGDAHPHTGQRNQQARLLLLRRPPAQAGGPPQLRAILPDVSENPTIQI